MKSSSYCAIVFLLGFMLTLTYATIGRENVCRTVPLKNCTFVNDNATLCGNIPTCSVPYDEFVTNARLMDGNAPRVEMSFPSWANYKLLQRGQRFVQDHWFSFSLAADMGRMANMVNADIRDVAMYTGAMSTSPVGCAKILASFGAKTMTWAQDLQVAPPTIPWNSDFLQSVNRIRWIHIKLSRDLLSRYRLTGVTSIVDPATYENITTNDIVWDAFHQDLVDSKIPAESRLAPPIVSEGDPSSIPFFNQQSLAYFQFNAFTYPILMGKTFGIGAVSEDDLWAYNHLSAVIGYTFGLDDKYNVAIQPNMSSLREYYSKIYDGMVIPSLFHINKKTKVTVENILVATRIHTPAWTLQLYLYRIATLLANVPAPNLAKLFNDQDKYHDNNLRTNVLPKLLVNPAFRRETNTKAINDLIKIGRVYYGNNYTTQYGRARDTFLTPIRNV